MPSENQNKNVSSESDSIDLGRLFGELIDHRKIIMSMIALFTFISLLYVSFATPIYQADALLQIEQKQGNSLINSLTQILPDSQPQSAPELALLQSRMILGKTVDDLNLDTVIEQEYFPIFGRGWARLTGEKPGEIQIGHYSILVDSKDAANELKLEIIDDANFLVEGNNQKIKGTVGSEIKTKDFVLLVKKIQAKSGTEFTITKQPRLKAIADLQKTFSVVDQGKDTGILTLTLLGDKPEHIKYILDNISENYLEQNISRQAAQDAKSLEFLDQQLPKIRADLDSSEDKLNQYRQQKDSVDLSLEAKSVLDQIVNVDNQLNELTFREAEVSQLYTKEHPTYKSLLEKRVTLEKERGRLNKRVADMPATQQEVLRLSRDVDSGKAVYMQLLNRQQELSIAKSSAIGNVRIIDKAVTEAEPVKPKKIITVLIGFILGLILSVSLVMLKVLVRKGIENPEQLEELGINVYASVPVSEWIQKERVNLKRKNPVSVLAKGNKSEFTKFLAIENPADLAIEAIRSLRTSLHFAMMEASNNVLMISGASPNAGKTFISSNLSAIIAQAGKRVLYIDADMRKGYAHKIFDTSINNGLSDVLSGKVELSHAVQKLPSIGFDFISRGAIPPNPAELLMHKRFQDLIHWATKNYDMVMLDTPPILAVTDAAIMGHYAGTTLVVARFEENTPKEIDVCIRRFEQNGISVKGCILNGVIKKASSYYGYGYNHYGYTYDDK